MKRIIIRLSLFFAVLVLMVIALSVPGFVAASRIPAQPGSSGLLRTALAALCIVVPLSAAVISALCVMMVSKDISLYEQILDSIPFPISVTDINMKWLFVNKPVLDMLGKKRGEFYGKHCSNWGAGICNTDNCGITCLRAGKNTTHFTQFESDFRVDISYVLNSKGNKVGHIELVRDITSESVLKKRQAQTAGQLSSIMATFSDDSRHVSDGAQALALHSTEQAAAAEELSGSILEISGMAKENMNNSTGALNEVEKTGELMAVCSEQMTRMLVAMKMIEDKSQSIGRTTKVIDDIAFQTNILALNAAVEAARAGAHGKGFAVVADEVRNLATKSAEAASETKTLIESSVASVADGNRIVAQVNESLKAAVEIAKINASKIAGVQSVSVQQSKAMEGITAGISQVSQVVQQNSATAEELASTSTEMNSHLDRINKLILALGQEAGPA